MVIDGLWISSLFFFFFFLSLFPYHTVTSSCHCNIAWAGSHHRTHLDIKHKPNCLTSQRQSVKAWKYKPAKSVFSKKSTSRWSLSRYLILGSKEHADKADHSLSTWLTQVPPQPTHLSGWKDVANGALIFHGG